MCQGLWWNPRPPIPRRSPKHWVRSGAEPREGRDKWVLKKGVRRRPEEGKGAMSTGTLALNFEGEKRNESIPVCEKWELGEHERSLGLQELWLGGVPPTNTYQRGTLS